MERRKERRYVVPELYQKYVTFKVKSASEFVDADLLDFGLYGIKIRGRSLMPVDTILECLIAIPKSLTREVSFRAKVKYCIHDGREGDYVVGGEITEIKDPLWLDLFSKIHDFIKERIGEIY